MEIKVPNILTALKTFNQHFFMILDNVIGDPKTSDSNFHCTKNLKFKIKLY